MSSFFKFILTNLFMIKFHYILLSIKPIFSENFINLKKLSSYDSYLVILDTGLYLYDLNISTCALIHEFTDIEFRPSSKNNINLTELYYGHKAYIFCLVNENLFIFNEYTYTLFNYTLNEINSFTDKYYNLMPYKIENNNISFIISLNKDTTNLIFYFYNFNLNESIIEPKIIIFDEMNIQNKMIECQINSLSTFIICFYFSINNEQNYFNHTIFNIKDMDLKISDISSILVTNKINFIKSEKSHNDKFFVCITILRTAKCFINDNLYQFKGIDCANEGGWTIYKVLYHKESDDFMLISPTRLTTTILDNTNNSVKICEKRIFSTQYNEFSIIYNNNDYHVINYTNFLNYMQCYDITILKNIKDSEQTNSIQNFIDNSRNNEEIIKNLNDFIVNDLYIINYINENNEVIIHKDEMTISFTSTYIQHMNEEANVTTINLGQCEMHLKDIYNISEDSQLYILKIDKEQKGKNYPLIEYEVFYPLNNGKTEILNLSLCEGLNIELCIPIKINDTLDKYDPKSNYYNDICTKSTSECNTDITLNDRKNEFIKNNMSLCEQNCELINYNKTNKKAKCFCDVKPILSLDNLEINSKNLLKNFIDIKRITNVEIIKCYKIVFKIKNLKKNYGSFIIIFIFIIYFLCLIIFYSKSWKNLINEIIKIKELYDKGKKENKDNKLNKKIYSFKKNNFSKKKRMKNSKMMDSLKIKMEKEKNIKQKNKLEKKSEIIYKRDKLKERNKNILEYTDSELNSLTYKEALKNDKRTYFQYYFSLLKKKISILFSFYPNKDYNSQIIKSFLFFFYWASDIAINALFFTDDTMHKIYVDSGEFNLGYQLPQIIYSFLISYVINFIIEYLSLSEDLIISIKRSKIINLHKNKKIINCMKVKFLLFFIVSFILLLIFWYYITCFCCVYENTQIHLFKDSLMSFVISVIYPIFINLLPGIFRIPSLNNKKGDKLCMYKFSQIIEFF